MLLNILDFDIFFLCFHNIINFLFYDIFNLYLHHSVLYLLLQHKAPYLLE